jgi:hypothetical protein
LENFKNKLISGVELIPSVKWLTLRGIFISFPISGAITPRSKSFSLYFNFSLILFATAICINTDAISHFLSS